MWARWSSNCAAVDAGGTGPHPGASVVSVLLHCRRAVRHRTPVADHFCIKTQAASFLASASLTFALAGIGTGPQTPELPWVILMARLSTASFWPAYLAATPLYAGPTSFSSTVWQATHCFSVPNATSTISCRADQFLVHGVAGHALLGGRQGQVSHCGGRDRQRHGKSDQDALHR